MQRLVSYLVPLPAADASVDGGGRDAALAGRGAASGTGAVGNQSAAGGGALHSGQSLRQGPAHQEIAYDVEAWDIHFEKSPQLHLPKQ